MLTKNDLKSIETIVKKRVREEVEEEGRNTRDELRSDILDSRINIQQDIRDLSGRIKNLEIRTTKIEKDLNQQRKETKQEFRKLNTRFNELFNFLDKDIMKTKKRVNRIEQHLNLDTATV